MVYGGLIKIRLWSNIFYGFKPLFESTKSNIYHRWGLPDRQWMSQLNLGTDADPLYMSIHDLALNYTMNKRKMVNVTTSFKWTQIVYRHYNWHNVVGSIQ